jgi:ribosomal peptide maturation radical SAM protein 1
MQPDTSIDLSDHDRVPAAGRQDVSTAPAWRTTGNPECSEAVRNFRVALVSMPFGPTFYPSLNMGLLKAIGLRAGFPVEDYYFDLDLAARIGLQNYLPIADGPCYWMTGEWLCSVAAFGDDASRADYYATFPEEAHRIAFCGGMDVAGLNNLRECVIPEFVDDCLNRVDWSSYRVVAFFSTLPALQTIGSLALARRIRQKYPDVRLIFLGTNVEGKMGLEFARAFSYVDHVIIGESDEVFPELLRRLADEGDPGDLLGVATRRCDGVVSFLGPTAPVRNLDNLPTPNYDTYFDSARRYRIDEFAETIQDPFLRFRARAIPFEASRGCWWGEKSHCIFCSLNGTHMEYRSKSAERVLAEMAELTSRYGRKEIWGADIVLGLKHINGLFAPLAAGDQGYQIYFMSKTNLRRDQLRLMARGGLRFLLPGVESINTRLLKLMRKGTTKLQNVNLLRWCAYYGIRVVYLLLHGFPGERMEDYEDQLATLRLITHTGAPMHFERARPDLFSPSRQVPGLFPTKRFYPFRAYSFVYPSCVNLEEVAYFFGYEPADGLLPAEALHETNEFVENWSYEWQHGAERPKLEYRRVGSDIVIHDTRIGLDHPKPYAILGSDADIYEAFISNPRTAAQVCRSLSCECPGMPPDEESIETTCESFCEAGLMIGEAGKYLSLALPAEHEF